MTRIGWMGAAGLALLCGCPAGDDGDTTGDGPDEVQVADITWELDGDLQTLIRVSWDQLADAEAYVEFSVDPGVWLHSPPATAAAGAAEALLLGAPYDVDITFHVVNDFGDGPLTSEQQTAQTGPAPEGLIAPTLLTAVEADWDPTLQYVLVGSSDDRGWTTIVDRQARVVWARQTPGLAATLYARPSYDGRDLLIDHNSYWAIFDDGAASQVVRMKIDGTELAVHDTPGLHHPFLELDDGTLVWGAADGLNETVEKLLPDGTREQIWDCADFHDATGTVGYCQSNTLFWSEADDTFLFSLYSDETIVEIDHATGETLRWFGHVPGAWSFDPPEAAFHWQHGGHTTEAGTLITSSHVDATSDECVVREYELDEASETLVEIWSFGVGLGVEAATMGEVHRLPGGNTLHNYGDGGRLREVLPDGTVVWDIAWDTGSTTVYHLGRTTPLDDLYAFAP
jgi:hypothetical protein